MGITHGDIKPGNILLKESGTVSTRHLGSDGVFRSRVSRHLQCEIFSHANALTSRQSLQEILQSPEIVICDLDEARLPRQQAYHPAGTPSYRAPEMVECKRSANPLLQTTKTLNLPGLYWNQKADIFSAGCVAYEVLTQRMLFPEQRLSSGPMPYHEHPFEILSPAAKWVNI